VSAALQAHNGSTLVRRDLQALMCRKFVKCATQLRNLYMSQLPSIVTFALHFGDINKGDSDNTKVMS
jgi:hypothetical protein